MLPEERMYVPMGLARLDDLFEHVQDGRVEATFNLTKDTLDYAKEHASYVDDDFDKDLGIVRIYVNGIGMNIIYSTVPTEFCDELFPIYNVTLDSCECEYYYVPDANAVDNFWVIV